MLMADNLQPSASGPFRCILFFSRYTCLPVSLLRRCLPCRS